ncbi:sulfotransferase family protein [Alteromonas oceanisediminis]|uniref:sulfotransferase family protein n=1 Tax=Alteromonas oceanisediminis TaxID=2836180 RepID=UPI001BD9BC42|nr:sulfotransferase [Alteromonas oceanisediminis]MBT0585683.1 sulfotransferase [Alteromonas oceanisediminis]
MVKKIAPVFIVGSQRSGTTMLRLMLNSHSDLLVPFEFDFLSVAKTYSDKMLNSSEQVEAFNALKNEYYAKKGGVLDEVNWESRDVSLSFSELFCSSMDAAAKIKGKQYWAIKTPGYHTKMDQLWRLFPDCKIVHIVRDGRAVAASQQNISWGDKDIIRIAKNWSHDIEMAHRMGAMIPNNYLEVRYETLVKDPEKTLLSISRFLSLDYQSGMLNYHESASKEVPQESLKWHKNSVSKPQVEKINEWKSKLKDYDIKIFQDYAKSSLELFEYEILKYKPSIKLKLVKIYKILKSKFE